ncbi:hypothetical protein QYM36_013384 [Artemia franciscana]|uniref:Transposase n=1 Tax=Artemia franciscana TaxID=6661 RepID=A0AA88HE45_ARTSF|nr:hypothetical protein QYM36_013384 [Artemia franciscana]
MILMCYLIAVILVTLEKYSAALKAEFQGNIPLLVHWDGKLIADLTSKDQFDQLPIMVSGKGVSQLLTVAKLTSGTGEPQAPAVYSAIEDWGITENIHAMCFGTTSSNTGRLAGACVLLEQKIGKELLSLTCWHHVMELLIVAVFQVCLGSTSAPQVPIFTRFQQYWMFLDQFRFKTGMSSDAVSMSVQDIKDSTTEFAKGSLRESQPRDDYREYFELIIIFLGLVPEREIQVMAPGATHHAQWMSKVIHNYSAVNSEISRVMSMKMANNLWYLSPETVGLAFFNDTIDYDTKKQMVEAVKLIEEEQPVNEHTRKISVDLKHLKKRNLEHFLNPGIWMEQEDYIHAAETVLSISAVNDHAERGSSHGSLAQELIGNITKDKSQ